MRMDGRTDMTKLIVALRNIANEPNRTLRREAGDFHLPKLTVPYIT